PPKMLVLADPCGDLSGAQKEAKVIRAELDKNGQVVVTTKTANITLDFVKKHIRDYDVLHYAGHADHGQSHDISGLRLADGCFSVNDIIKLGVTAPLPALIFCNACQSAHDNSDDMSRGIFGIANAFLTSGVRHYVGCLWKIPDRESVTAAQLFYRSVFSGTTVGEALRLTRLELIRQYGWSSLVWASYVLYGDPSIVFGVSSETPSIPSCKSSNLKKVILVIVAVFLLAVGISLAAFNYNRPPEPPAIVIDDFIVPSTQKKDMSLTFDVLNELKKISSANLVVAQQASGANFTKARVRRAVHSEVEKNDGQIRLIVKVLDPASDKIISLKEFTVKEGAGSAKEIAERILDLTKVGLSKAEEVELTRRPDENPEAHRLLSRSWDLFTKGDFSGSLQLCEQIKKIDPENRDLYKRMGNIYDRLGKREKALDAYFKYADLCKKSNDLKNLANAYINMGWIIQIMGDAELAYKHFDKALQIAQLGGYSYETAKALSQLGSWYSQKKDLVKAKELLLKAIEINQNSLPDYNHR
ncbi:MAG: CHAT domain-containing protein, partial [Candidatus Omnitrophota bacterium]